MGSTIYQRGEAAGQRKTIARLITKRFGAEGEALVTRTQLANESVLDQAVDLFGEKLSDEILLEKLEHLLPKPDESSDEDEPE